VIGSQPRGNATSSGLLVRAWAQALDTGPEEAMPDGMTARERRVLMAEVAVMVEVVSDLVDRLGVVADAVTNAHRQPPPRLERGARLAVRDPPASSEDAP
jgi:hypothetical protein